MNVYEPNPRVKGIIMTKEALLRLTVFSLKLIFNGSAWGTFTLALKLLFLKH